MRAVLNTDPLGKKHATISCDASKEISVAGCTVFLHIKPQYTGIGQDTGIHDVYHKANDSNTVTPECFEMEVNFIQSRLAAGGIWSKR